MRNRLVRLYRKWSLAIMVQPVVILVVVFKAIFYMRGLEILDLSPLLSGLIAANVFLLGFLISGVLVDYKESEKLPGELAASLASISDEVSTIFKNNQSKAARNCLTHILVLTISLKNWFYKKERTSKLMDNLSRLNDLMAAMGSEVDAGSIDRVKGEQSAIRRTVIRVRTIRGTFFVPSGYAVAEATSTLVIVGLWITRAANLIESLFFVGLIAFLTTYMLFLIKRLDNPFDYYSRESGVDEISLLPLDEVQQRIQELINYLERDASRLPGEQSAMQVAQAH